MTTRGALGGYLGAHGARNAHGEIQQRLDVLANEVLVDTCQRSGGVAALASKNSTRRWSEEAAGAPYLLVFDPLDGSSNIDVNLSIGTIFSVLQRLNGLTPAWPISCSLATVRSARLRDLRSADDAGAQRGPRHARLTLDHQRGVFTLTHPQLRAEESHEFAINTSNARFWKRRCSATSAIARPATRARGATSTCAGSRRWWPRPIGS
jgi:fructose-1,6-bisphosphatase